MEGPLAELLSEDLHTLYSWDVSLCIHRCRDYLMIDLAQRGDKELCEEPGYQYVVQEGFKATFRTNYHEEDANKKKCEEGTWITGVSGDYYKGFQVYCMCFDDECK